jgi:two-component system, OmpR family, sensor histidine kinase KdpD
VSANLARDLPYVRADANLLEQVLFNLFDNANKYAAGSGVTIYARPDGAEIAIAITDEGPGVKPGDVDRIFEKFYRGGRADGRRVGTGLGLSISRGLIEAMGGTIRAESPAVRRRGLRLIIRLPTANAAPDEERAA